MDGGHGVGAVDLRRRMVAQLLAIERQISDGREHTKEAASAFSAVILSARSLAHPTISHREKLNELKNRLQKLEHDLAEALSTIEAFGANSDATEKLLCGTKSFLVFKLLVVKEGYFVGLDLVVLMLRIEALLYYPISTRPRWKIYAGENVMQETGLIDAEINYYTYNERKNRNKNGAYIDKDGVARTFNRKKISRKRVLPRCYLQKCCTEKFRNGQYFCRCHCLLPLKII
ncbi:hypothetical protein ABZP36_032226 [Zizania latifolia]